MNVKAVTFLLFFSFATYSVVPYYTSNLNLSTHIEIQKATANESEQCDPDIAPFYVYDLPNWFNEALLRNCSKLDPWMNLCPYIENQGMANRLTNLTGTTHTSSPPTCYSMHEQ